MTSKRILTDAFKVKAADLWPYSWKQQPITFDLWIVCHWNCSKIRTNRALLFGWRESPSPNGVSANLCQHNGFDWPSIFVMTIKRIKVGSCQLIQTYFEHHSLSKAVYCSDGLECDWTGAHQSPWACSFWLILKGCRITPFLGYL